MCIIDWLKIVHVSNNLLHSSWHMHRLAMYDCMIIRVWTHTHAFTQTMVSTSSLEHFINCWSRPTLSTVQVYIVHVKHDNARNRYKLILAITVFHKFGFKKIIVMSKTHTHACTYLYEGTVHVGNMRDSFLNLNSICSVVTGQMLGWASSVTVGSVHGASLGRPDICHMELW